MYVEYSPAHEGHQAGAARAAPGAGAYMGRVEAWAVPKEGLVAATLVVVEAFCVLAPPWNAE